MNRSTSTTSAIRGAGLVSPAIQDRGADLVRSAEVSRRTFLTTSVMALGGALLPAHRAFAQQITTTDLGGALLLRGAGCNVVAMPGPDGALMVDGGRAANVEALIAAVKSGTHTSRIHTLINTHWHPEQTGANELVGRSGGVIFAHEKTKVSLSNTVYASVTFAGRLAPLAKEGRPTRTT